MEIEKKLDDIAEQVNDHSLAMEILRELKAHCKKLWIALFIVIALWFATIGGFVWYLSLYDFISYEQDGSGYNNINTDVQGDVYNNNGTETSNPQEKVE